jgi:hypothetical protein
MQFNLLSMLLVAGVPAALAAPSTCLTDSTLTGYDNWDSLRLDMYQGVRNKYIVCPNTDFVLGFNDPWIDITWDEAPFILQCGVDGRLENNCTITGGFRHFYIHGGTSGITIAGFTLAKAHCGSVHFECCDSEASFENCLWKVRPTSRISCRCHAQTTLR